MTRMNKKIADALEFIKDSGLKKVILAIPFPISAGEVLALRALPICKGMILLRPSPEITATSTDEWLGCFENHGWSLPRTRSPIVFVGSHLMLTRRMVTTAVKTNRFSIICKINGTYRKLPLYRLLLWRTGDKLLRSVHQQSPHHPLRRLAEIAKDVPLIRKVWRGMFRRGELSPSSTGFAARRNPDLSEEALYKELLLRASACAKSAAFHPVPRRVLLVNAGLAAGGAERQIVNTLIGLNASGQCESVGLLAEYIDHAPHLDFFLHELEAKGIAVSQVKHTVSLSDDGLFSVAPEVADLLACISPGLIEEILNLVEEFRVRRPEVVHAWQDTTSIKVGIAAVIAGVPRIVLASRNVTPMNFTYHQDYMRPAYLALASLDCITLLNNSEAGATDYTKWLGLPRDSFVVVRNGVDLGYLKRADATVVREYRQSLGIPADAEVVGSIFRFWEEKRPMLWLQTAALVAKRFPEIHFLIIGEGPMRQEMEAFISTKGLTGRVHLPGARPDVAPALSAMNVFLLTSEFEGTPNVVLEAQWLGLPIVATDAGGTRESFEPDVTGLLALTSEADEIAFLIGRYLSDQELAIKAGIVGPQFVDNAFSVRRMIQNTISLYELDNNIC